MRVVEVCRRCPDFMEDGGVCRCLKRQPAAFGNGRGPEWISLAGYRRKRTPAGCRFREEMFREWCAGNPDEALNLRLLEAVRRDDLALAERLIAEGADPGADPSGEGRNLLFDYIYGHWRFNSGSPATVRFLLRHGVAPDGCDRSGRTLRQLLDGVICDDFRKEVAAELDAVGRP